MEEFIRLLAEKTHQRFHPGLELACYKTSLADKICPVVILAVNEQLADFSFSALEMMHSLCYVPCQSSMAREIMVLGGGEGNCDGYFDKWSHFQDTS